MERFSRLVTITPVVCSSDTIFPNVEVFRVVDVLVRPCLDPIDNLFPASLASSRSDVAIGLYCIINHVREVLGRSGLP